ncbi:MAG TPA: ATP-binding cassette domain-containing protein [Brevundimonas sp.]|jgi:cell division transport system ATP-binding protein|uniref:cell division ATP-binding protein FtsE n=1 Tax=Brevundimonas sp. TaxID=1871086 RepID=UPI002C93E9D5|nr:ATP-binding cassette domain-containing protein [Brevundimonas sp.]HRH21154.1 ATP-binding cassette domain-containing protein [Brevundimonas sp.]
MSAQTAAPVSSAVRFDAVSLRYSDDGPDILKDVGFNLPAGSFHFLTGPSGAGKSSLLRLIYLGAVPSRGHVRVFGQETTGISAADRVSLRRRMGVVFHDFRLIDHLSAFDNAALPLRVAGQKPKAYVEDVQELLTWVGLGTRASALPPALSAGEKQRLAIARAVVGRPWLILADEPTGAVDADMAVRILRLFVELNRLGATVVIATHDRELVGQSGMPSLHLEQGRLMQVPA